MIFCIAILIFLPSLRSDRSLNIMSFSPQTIGENYGSFYTEDNIDDAPFIYLICLASGKSNDENQKFSQYLLKRGTI